MSFLLLDRDGDRRLLAQGGRVPAADVPMVREAAELLAAARRIQAQAEADVAAASATARAAAHAEGLAAGRAAAEAEAGARLFALELAAAETRAATRARVADMALAVVRRIAGELGDGPLVAAIAAKAATELEPDSRATVRVPPQALTAARAAVQGFPVEADPALGPTDCVVETPLGRTMAGLDTQLAAISRAWAAARPRADADAA